MNKFADAHKVGAVREPPLRKTNEESQGLPEGWVWTRLDTVGVIITGNTPSKKDYANYGDDIPFVKPPELIDKGIFTAADGLSRKGSKSARILPHSAVLVSCIGILGKTGIAKVPIAFNQQINAIIFSEAVVPEFGFYYLQTIKKWLYSVASATTLPIVNKGKFQKAPFPLAPFPIQKLIVAEIEKQFSRLDEAVAALRRVQANLKRYKASVLKAAVEGRLTEEWREQNVGRGDSRIALTRTAPTECESGADLLKRILAERRKKWEEDYVKKYVGAHGHAPKDDLWKKKYREPVEPDTSSLPELPEGWVWAALEQIAEHIVDGTHHTPTYVETGIPFISAKDIDKWNIDFVNSRRITETEHDQLIKRCHPKSGNILVTKSGTIGRVAIVKTDMSFSLFESVALIPLILSVPNFIGYVVNVSCAGEFGKSQQKGVAVRHLHLEDLRRLPVPLPPLSEQAAIVENVERRLSVAEEIEAVIETNLKRAERMRQAILKKAFEGRLVA